MSDSESVPEPPPEPELPNRGTISGNPEFDAEFSATRFCKAMKGIGTDDRVIIDQLVKHNNEQRLHIVETYKAMYGRDLIDDLMSELGGNFETAVVALLSDPDCFLADNIIAAFSGPGADADLLTEILCCRNEKELEDLSYCYEEKTKNSLDRALKSELSGSFRDLMRGLMALGRDQTPEPNIELAQEDAQALYDAGVGQNSGKDEMEFIRIMNLRSFPQLNATFKEHENLAHKPFEASLKSTFKGNFLKGLLAIAQRVQDPLGFFARRLKESIAGPRTDDKTLIRILVSRSEIDLADIKETYKEMYSRTLKGDVEEDTSGDYMKLLLAILGD